MKLFEIFGTVNINDREAIGKMDSIERKGTQLGNSFKKIGKIIVGAFSVKAIVDFEKKIISTFSTYDDQMRIVRAVTGATQTDYQELRNEAEKLGRSTRYSAVEAGEGMENLGRAGWETTEILSETGNVLTFATANAIDLSDAATIVANGLSQFNLETQDTVRYTDVLSVTSREANTDVQLIGETFNQVGPLAGSLGYKLEDVAVAIGMMANKGIVGGQAGTVLRNVIATLSNPTDEASKKLKKLGISMTDSNGQIKPFNQLLVEMRGKLSKLSEAQQAQAITSIFGRQSLAGMMALVNTSSEDFSTMTNAIADANGTTKEMQEIMDGGIGGAIESVKSAWEGLLISLGNIQEGPLVDFLNGIAEKLQKLPEIIEKNQEHIATTLTNIVTVLSNVAKAVGKAISLIAKHWNVIKRVLKVVAIGTISIKAISGAIWGVTKVINIASKGVSIFGKVLGFIVSPAGLVVSAIVAVIAIGVLLYQNWSKISEWLKDTFERTAEFISNIWTNIKDFFINIWENISNIFSSAIESIDNFFRVAWQGIINFFINAWEIVTLPFKFIWEIIKSIIASAMAIIEGIIGTVLGAIRFVWDIVWHYIGNTVMAVWEKIKNIIVITATYIKNIITTIFNSIKTIISTVWNTVRNITLTIWNGIKDTIISILQTTKEIIYNIINNIKETIARVWDTVRNITQKVFSNVKEAMVGPINKAKELIEKALEAIKGFFKKLKLKFPKIERPKLPKFSIKGEFSVMPPKVPKIGIDWFAKGGVMKRPTLFGAYGDTILGGGEAGTEGIVPLKGRHMLPMADAIADRLEETRGNNSNNTIKNEFKIGSLVVREEADIERIAEELYRLQERKMRTEGAF